MTAEDLAAQCTHARPLKGGWLACCPAHDDHTPSLSLRDGEKGVILKCFAGCTTDAICTALGITVGALFYEEAPCAISTAPRQEVATYEYTDTEGTLLYQVVRFAPKTFRQRRPDPDRPGQWIPNLHGIPPVLYHLPRLQEAIAREALVYLVEGEKDVHSLEALGVCATTNPMGAGKWRPQYTEALRGAQVVILPDNDPPGEAHATTVSQALQGVAASVRTLRLPGLPPKGDVSDWIAQGGTLTALEMLSAPGDPGQADASQAIGLTDLADMLERTYPEPSWLVPTLIPAGLTFFIGSPKSSKTYLAYSLALSLAYEAQRGGKWLEQYPITARGPVVYVSLEDDEADSRLRIAELAPWLTSIERGRFLFVHGFDLPRFDEGLVGCLQEQVIARYHPALIVLDPISYLYAPTRKNADQFAEVKDMLLPLRWLGKANQCAIIGVDHRRKKSADDVDIFETLYGSQAKVAVADSLLMIVRDDKEVTVHTKVRKGPEQTLTLAFEFAQDGTARWLWKGAVGGLMQSGTYGDLRQQVLTNLAALGAPMSIPDILASCTIPDSKASRNALYQVLFRAQKDRQVQKTTRGHYVWSGEDA